MTTSRRRVSILIPVFLLSSCTSAPPAGPLDPPPLAAVAATPTVIASSATLQWTGIAVSREGRTFVTFPRWPGPHEFSLAQLRDAQLWPYPDASWNAWTPGSGARPGEAFICVQSAHIDRLNRLWVLDAANPDFHGVIPGGPKLVRIDLATNQVARIHPFPDSIAPSNSYLNDVRVDPDKNFAYITDSGTGAIVVLNLATGAVRRRLAGHASTKAEDIVPVIGGKELRFADGSVPRINADGLALDIQGGYLYYQALSARTLYRIPTATLNDLEAPDSDIEAKVENLGASVVTDGMEIDPKGNLYLSALELNAVVVRRPDGTFATVARDDRLAWPDSFAFTPSGDLLVTCSQIHRSPLITGGPPPATPYLIVSIPADALPH